MLQIEYSINNCTISQPTSFEPQLRIILSLKYLKWTNQAFPEAIEIIDLKGRIMVRTNNNTTWFDIGSAEQETRTTVRLGDTVQVHLVSYISPYVLDKIEKLRSGNDLWFKIQSISGKALFETSSLTSIDIPFFQERGITEGKYPKSEWIEHLNSTYYNKLELIEIPKVELPKLPLTNEIMKFLNQANKAMNEGRYDDVLAECRGAIDALDKGIEEWGSKISLTEEENNKIKQNGKQGTKREIYLPKLMNDKEKGIRLSKVIGNLHYYLSLSPHEAEHNSQFTIYDARFVLHSVYSYTANILEYILKSTSSPS